MANLILSYVPTSMARDLWPLVSGLISRAVKRGLGSHRVIREMVMDGRALIWIATDGKALHACAVTSLATDEDRKVCEIVALAGRGMREWLPLQGGLEKYARSEGCSAMRMMGRRGWQRVLKDYRAKHVILEKDL